MLSFMQAQLAVLPPFYTPVLSGGHDLISSTGQAVKVSDLPTDALDASGLRYIYIHKVVLEREQSKNDVNFS